MSKSPIEYEERMWVSFSDLDPYGHLATHNYLDLSLEARWTYAKRVLDIDPQDITSRGIGFYNANFSCNFLKPIIGQQEIVCRSRVSERVGAKLLLTFEIVSASNPRELFFTGSADCFCVDMNNGKPIHPPAWVDELFFEDSSESRAKTHYEETENIYRDLSNPPTDYMNFGFWPASSLGEAQKNLVDKALATCPDRESVKSILEIGSGWGASRDNVEHAFEGANYTGINISEGQIESARSRNTSTRTEYISADATDFLASTDKTFDLAFSVEAFHHIRAKTETLSHLALRSKRLCLAEICVAKFGSFIGHPTLDGPLADCWTMPMYAKAFAEAGYTHVSTENITRSTVSGMNKYVASLPGDYLGEDRTPAMKAMKRSFESLEKAAKRGLISYNLISAWRD